MKRIFIVIILLFNVILAYANVDFHLSVDKKIMKNGKSTLVSVKETNPGDTLIYTLKVTNNNMERVTNVSPTVPIPKYTTLIPELIMPNTSYMVSTDKQNYKTYPYLGADGRPVADSMYKSIRWRVNSMEPNEIKMFRFGVSVN